MIGRLSLTVVIGLAVLVWMLADPPVERQIQMPPPKPIAANEPKPEPKSMAMAEVTLPPPPAPPEAAPEPKSVTPLTPEAKPESTKATTVEPLQTQPQKLEPKAEAEVKTIQPMAPTPPPAQAPEKPKQAAPQPKPAPTPKHAASEGRPLLRLLEHGKGPSVEIAWPEAASHRRHLFRVFKQCYGMRVAVMAADGNLFDGASNPGQPWAVNLDRFSGFVRQSGGNAALEEHRTARQIRDRHGLWGATTVRLFPRGTDALLLGGLKHLIGGTYKQGARITARYQVTGWRVRVGGIAVDARPVAGHVDLSGSVQGRCVI